MHSVQGALNTSLLEQYKVHISGLMNYTMLISVSENKSKQEKTSANARIHYAFLKPSFHMIAMIATIAAQGSQRSLRSLRAYGNIHSAIFAIVATVIAEIEKFLSLRSLRSL